MWNLSALRDKAFSPVDASFLGVFRIGFGLIMLWEAWRYLSSNWIESIYIRPAFLFKYYGFDWVHPWPGDGMYYHFILFGVLAVLIMLGLLYRLAAVLFFFVFTYVFLLDQAYYLNHFYFVILVSFILIFLPANRSMSLDAKWRPPINHTHVPVWTLWILRAQMEVVLLYAGIVKINADWLQLQPMTMWMAKRADFPVLGFIFTQEWAIAVACYGVIILHVVGAPLLLWRKTRLAVFIAYAFFHTLNHFVFTIGIFPWFTMFGTLVFFDPDWPKQLYSRVRSWITKRADAYQPIQPQAQSNRTPVWMQHVTLTLLLTWLFLQIAIPLRHYLYPGDVAWTEEGHRFSWRMKLRTKSGFADFEITDPVTRQVWKVKPESYLSRRQTRKMAVRPDMILQFAHYLAEIWRKEKNVAEPQVRVINYVSLNGRDPAPMVDPSVDLTKIKRNLWPADWILPLAEPLKPTAGQNHGQNQDADDRNYTH